VAAKRSCGDGGSARGGVLEQTGQGLGRQFRGLATETPQSRDCGGRGRWTRTRLDCETKMNSNGRVRDDEPNVATSFSGLAHDVIELSELQAQLFAHDVKCTTQKTRTSLLLSVVGACVLLGSVPVLLFALGELITEQTGWPLSAGLAIGAVVGIAISAGLMLAAWNRLSSGLSSLQRSRDEFSRNIAWIKSSLRSQPTKPETRRTTRADAPTNPR